MTRKGSHDLEASMHLTVSREPDLRSWKADLKRREMVERKRSQGLEAESGTLETFCVSGRGSNCSEAKAEFVGVCKSN
jgi:hypothetical protein